MDGVENSKEQQTSTEFIFPDDIIDRSNAGQIVFSNDGSSEVLATKIEKDPGDGTKIINDIPDYFPNRDQVIQTVSDAVNGCVKRDMLMREKGRDVVHMYPDEITVNTDGNIAWDSERNVLHLGDSTYLTNDFSTINHELGHSGDPFRSAGSYGSGNYKYYYPQKWLKLNNHRTRTPFYNRHDEVPFELYADKEGTLGQMTQDGTFDGDKVTKKEVKALRAKYGEDDDTFAVMRFLKQTPNNRIAKKILNYDFTSEKVRKFSDLGNKRQALEYFFSRTDIIDPVFYQLKQKYEKIVRRNRLSEHAFNELVQEVKILEEHLNTKVQDLIGTLQGQLKEFQNFTKRYPRFQQQYEIFLSQYQSITSKIAEEKITEIAEQRQDSSLAIACWVSQNIDNFYNQDIQNEYNQLVEKASDDSEAWKKLGEKVKTIKNFEDNLSDTDVFIGNTPFFQWVLTEYDTVYASNDQEALVKFLSDMQIFSTVVKILYNSYIFEENEKYEEIQKEYNSLLQSPSLNTERWNELAEKVKKMTEQGETSPSERNTVEQGEKKSELQILKNLVDEIKFYSYPSVYLQEYKLYEDYLLLLQNEDIPPILDFLNKVRQQYPDDKDFVNTVCDIEKTISLEQEPSQQGGKKIQVELARLAPYLLNHFQILWQMYSEKSRISREVHLWSDEIDHIVKISSENGTLDEEKKGDLEYAVYTLLSYAVESSHTTFSESWKKILNVISNYADVQEKKNLGNICLERIHTFYTKNAFTSQQYAKLQKNLVDCVNNKLSLEND